MPTFHRPTSDDDRLGFLETAARTAVAERAAGRRTITQATLDAIVAFVAVFRPLYKALTRTLVGRMKEVRERETARARLDMFVRDFWEVLKRRARRLGHPAETLVLFGLAADGGVPVLSTFADLIAAAEKIATGEAQAVAGGLPAMANPSAGEVAAELAATRAQAADVPPADRAYDEAQAAVAPHRPEADLLVDDVMADLRSEFRRLDPPSLRRVQRAHGARFDALPGEPKEEDDGGAGGATGSPGGVGIATAASGPATGEGGGQG